MLLTVLTLELSPFLVTLGVGLLVTVLEVLVPLVGALELAIPPLTLFSALSPGESPALLLLPLSIALFPTFPDPGP